MVDTSGVDSPEALYLALVRALRGPQAAAEIGGAPAGRRKFGDGALKEGGRIYAMLTRDALVVKLPAARVAALVASGAGAPFDAGKGKPMKEWVMVAPAAAASWRPLAEEARAFARAATKG
ncbi:MAG: hypothetical protein KGI57_01805 [Hyphomicrobiales bacterium]|nr:hypothetical protein [Hyphomicrobiales bacterium]